ncbi:(Trans)glycosidase [Glarea lozoyensis ATCC 20868]|uniref:Beta-mannosidase A n=1 Tax=Glarea lozoyensis (strain ATCC 20868 / MF5171) TaxID=1116229 RepID=S3E4N1_GLAL2|nr:(Trans)glycosidase [Glarea lozoyensis ATCC 20868]EPE33363.1 (Trans)glycosidase [Glarea lozoyensis ATCC 20868]
MGVLHRLQVPLVALLSYTAIAQKVIDLGTKQWTLSSPVYNISVPGRVPSQVHLDLFREGVIPDPYVGLGDFELRWVTLTNWTYETTLDGLDSTIPTWLLFNGLDTFTSIEVCGQHVASTNNQFRQYYFEISDILKSCSTTPDLSINFGSAVNITADIASEPGQEVWPPGQVFWPGGVEGVFEFPNRQFMRKEQSDFGWDWGPAFAPAGVWQPAYVVQLPGPAVHVRNTLLDIYRQGQLNNLPPDQNAPWIVNASIDVIGSLPSNAKLFIEIMDIKNVTVASGAMQNMTSIGSTITGSVVVDGETCQLWWPVGLGPQNLYYFKITVMNGNESLVSITKRSGFRTIVLNMTPISESQLAQGIAPGNNWHFEINGQEFYAKGSNFIPPDAFWPRVTETKMNQLFQSVVDGNQNMLRVWASGAYTPDFIYDIADEMGVLLWSEFEFGDALYPVGVEFLENVRQEAEYNVRRVNHHPSLALWAGGNELENLELRLAAALDPGNDRWRQEYEQLFLGVLLPTVFANSKSISYIPSSTTNGYLELNFSLAIPMIQRYDNATKGSIYGDTDHYDYNSLNAFDLSTYPVGRFANEFGFHSMPSLQSWQQVLSPEDLHFNSTTIVLRNHHYPAGGPLTDNFHSPLHGMGEMTLAAQRYYPVPNMADPVANFSAWCQTTQIFQADFYRSQITYYRRGSGKKERQLGSLYWQLEDIWQAPTWAGIEYDGRWKFLHYVAKDIYQPVIIASYLNTTDGDLTAYVTSDLWSPATGVATLTWYDYNGTILAPPSSVPFTVGALNITQVLQTNTKTIPYDLTKAVLKMNITATGSLPNTNDTKTFKHEFFFHALDLSKANLQDPGLQLEYNASTGNFTIEATKAVAAWVWMDIPAGTLANFDGNAFWLVPGEKREVGVVVKSDGSGGKWVEGVRVRSLWDNTQS